MQLVSKNLKEKEAIWTMVSFEMLMHVFKGNVNNITYL